MLKPLSIRGRLILLALGSSLPLAAFGALLALEFVHRQYTSTRDVATERVRVLSQSIDLALLDVESNLRTLAASPAIAAGDFVQFRLHAAEVNRLTAGLGIVLVDRTGKEVMHTERDPRAEPDLSRPMFEAVLASGRAQVTGIVRNASAQPAVRVQVPVRVNDAIAHVLVMTISPDRFLNLLKAQDFPPRWIAAVADGAGLLIARIPDHDRRVGQPGGRFLGSPERAIPQSWVSSLSVEGIPVYGAYQRSAISGWTTGLAVPQEELDAPSRSTILFVSLIGSMAVLLSLLVAFAMTRAITRPLGRLAQASRTDFTSSEPMSGIAEIDSVRDSLTEAARARRQAIERASAQTRLLEGVVQSLPIAVNVAEVPSGRFLFVNEEMKRLWGAAYGDIDDLARNIAIRRFRRDGSAYRFEDLPLARTIRTGENIRDEEVAYETPNGELRTMVVNSAPVTDSNGEVVAAVAAIYDVTERKQASDRQKLLLDEINHRSKNAMATVQSIARLSARSSESKEEFMKAFEERLVALSHAYDLLARYRWQGAMLQDLLETTLRSHFDKTRISLSGPPAYVSPRIALALTSGINELATNSVKYGALSGTAGRVELSWTIGAGDHVALTWQEKDGPAVQAPSRRGFGTRFIEQILAAELRGEVTLTFEATGLACTIAFPLRERASVPA